MQIQNDILTSIKSAVSGVDPNATVILYGSFARGENKPESDIDLLILVDKGELSYKDKTRLSYPLYDIEFKTGQIISPLVLSRTDWETRHRITPFYENITKEGITL